MKYRNANCILPKELLAQIQEYVQGEYIYIPIKDKRGAALVTGYQTELKKRDAHIYTKYLEGMNKKQLAELYHLSESSIRRILLKQKKGFEQMEKNVKQVLRSWGLQEREVEQIYDTAWQVGEEYVLKVYRKREQLERNLNMLRRLDEMGIPVGKIVPTLEQKDYASGDGFSCFLSERLLGNNMAEIAGDGKIARKMGGIIAKLHRTFRECEDMEGIGYNSLLADMRGWVKGHLEKTGWKYLDQEDYERIVDRLAAVYEDLPVQLIHRDVHFGNFLFSGGEFSGYIDFDLSQRNIRIFDICYFLLGLLSEEEKLDMTEEQWFVWVRDVFDGYEEKLEVSETEKEAVPCVMECIELLFVAYFESIKDVQCAEDAYKIFEFVRQREERIRKSVG